MSTISVFGTDISIRSNSSCNFIISDWFDVRAISETALVSHVSIDARKIAFGCVLKPGSSMIDLPPIKLTLLFSEMVLTAFTYWTAENTSVYNITLPKARFVSLHSFFRKFWPTQLHELYTSLIVRGF